MDAGRSEKSFWKTTTGMLTAGASFVAALATLLTAVSQLRGDGDGNSEPATPPPPVAAARGDVNEEELIGRIPPAIAPTCERATNGEPGAVAALNCRFRAVVGLQYNLYASAKETRAGYEEARRRYGVRGTGRTCEAGDYEGDYVVDGDVEGGRLCFVDDEVAAVVWTHEDLEILSFAWRDDRDLPALVEAWSKGVGPVGD